MRLRALTSNIFFLRKQMRTKFLRNLASFDSIDKMGLPPLSDSSEIYHICAQNSPNYPTRTRRTSWSVRHVGFLWRPDSSVRVHPGTQSRSFSELSDPDSVPRVQSTKYQKPLSDLSRSSDHTLINYKIIFVNWTEKTKSNLNWEVFIIVSHLTLAQITFRTEAILFPEKQKSVSKYFEKHHTSAENVSTYARQGNKLCL